MTLTALEKSIVASLRSFWRSPESIPGSAPGENGPVSNHNGKSVAICCTHGCQMAIAKFLDLRGHLALSA